jgi:proline iminopeptidase
MSEAAFANALFPPIEPYRHGMLPVDGVHTLYWEECGNPDGVPVLFLHGGPGGGISPNHRRFYDPAHYRIVLFDQRGAGMSTPLGEFRNNTTQLLIEDIERLRAMLGIERWLVFGGSWGSTLALAYGETHPQRCLGFILRGIFLATRDEIDFFINGMRWFYPELHEDFAAPIPADERGDLLAAYAKRILCDDPVAYRIASRDWSRFEGRRMFLLPQNTPEPSEITAHDIGLGRLETHYMANAAFLEEDQLVRDVGRIAHLPSVIVQGRYDVICPPLSAYRLHKAWPGSRLNMIPDAGHAALEPSITRALVAATEQFKRAGTFA